MSDTGYWASQLVAWAAGIVIQVLFLLTLRGLLRAVAPENRAMRPNLVWINLVPYVEFVWMFVTLVKVRDSLRAEGKARGLVLGGDPAFRVGLVSAILWISTFGLSWLALLGPSPVVEIVALTGLASLGFWIAYWMRCARLRVALAGAPVTTSEPADPRCPECGLLPLPDDDYCRSCGLELGRSAQEQQAEEAGRPGTAGECPFCGAAYRPGAKYCSACGRAAV